MKLIIAALLCLMPLCAGAEKLAFVSNAKDGGRWMADADSFKMGKSSYGIAMHYYLRGEHVVYWVVVRASACANEAGTLFVWHDDSTNVNKADGEYPFSYEATKKGNPDGNPSAHDVIGTFLCMVGTKVAEKRG